MELSNKVTFCVLGTQERPFVKLVRKRKDHIGWINFSCNTYIELMNEREELDNGRVLTYFDLEVEITEFEGKKYVTFSKTSGLFKRRLNLGMEEWDKFVMLEREARERLENPKLYEMKVGGMVDKYMVRDGEKNYYFFDDIDAKHFGVHELKQDPCVVVSTLLPNPSPVDLMNQLFAYVITLSLRTACEGCENNYLSQRDHPCLMEWVEKVERGFEEEFGKVKLFPIYEARLRKKFDTFKKSKPQKSKVKDLVLTGQVPEYEYFMRNVTSTGSYLDLRAYLGQMQSPLIEGWK